jgi:hypothetical protein
MDPAIIGTMRIGHFRIGVFSDEWDRLIQTFESKGSVNVTRKRLMLGSQDSTTGWYTKRYEDSTIKMPIQERGSSLSMLPAGTYVRTAALGLTADVVEVGDRIVTNAGKYWEVDAVREIYSLGGGSFSRRECDLTPSPFRSLTGASYTESSVEDARYRTKVYLETYLDDDVLPNYIIAYGEPNYPLLAVFKTRSLDLAFTIAEPESRPKMDFDHEPYGYEEHVGVHILTVDKLNISGTKLKWQGETELRRVLEENPLGSLRSFERRRSTNRDLGGVILYDTEWMLTYCRDTT